jgi:poly(3-hydroxybutyrate) depolymerase
MERRRFRAVPLLFALLCMAAISSSATAAAKLSSKQKKTFARKASQYWFYRHHGAPAGKTDRILAELGELEGLNWEGLRSILVKPYGAPAKFKKRRNNVELRKPPAELKGCTYIVAAPPGYSPRRSYPLVVALHGGGRGVGSAGQIMGLLGGHYQSKGCIVAAPTVPPGAVFAEPVGEKFVREILWEVALDYAVDPDRIYCTGHSMGGVGAWYMPTRMPDIFAASSPAAGNPSCVVDYEMFYNTPLYVVHGSTDVQVKPDQDREAAKAIKAIPAKNKRKGFFVYREITTGDARGHALPAKVIKDMSSWMLKYKRNWIPERVICVCPFLRTNEQAVIPYSRSFWIAIDGCAFKGKVDAVLEKDNVIRITASGANKIEVFLSDDMVNLDRPVRIFLNGRQVHDKVVPRSVEFLLRHIEKTRDRGRAFANKVVLDG